MDWGLSMETICPVLAETFTLFFTGVYYSEAIAKNTLQRADLKTKGQFKLSKGDTQNWTQAPLPATLELGCNQTDFIQKVMT